MYSLKGPDYEQDYKGRVGMGAKSSYVNSVNNFDRYNVHSNEKVKDTLRSNDFQLQGNINAVYVNYNKQYKGVMIQAGLRVEKHAFRRGIFGFTGSNGAYESYDSVFKRDYTDFFPNAAVTFNKTPKASGASVIAGASTGRLTRT